MCRTLLVSLWLVFHASFAWAQDKDLSALRLLYHTSYASKETAREFYRVTRNDVASPLRRGYMAMAGIMMCNHVGNPYTKLKYFYAGKQELEQAINDSPENTELRYLRFAVQCNTPSILGYKDNLAEDRQVLIRWLASPANRQADADLYKKIHSYMMNCSEVSASQKKQLASGG